jgi:hypothetical protein
MDRDRVVEKFGQGVVVKKEWAENPKSPLANHIGNSMPIKYECQTGTVGGKRIYRWVKSSTPLLSANEQSLGCG